MIMFAPNDGEGEGASPGDTGASVFDEPEGDEPDSGNEAAPAGATVSNPAPVAPVPVFDATAMAKAFGDVIGTHFKPVAPEPARLTPEQIQQKLNVWMPTKEWIAKFDNLETRDAAIAEQRDGLIRQADTIAQLRMQEMQTANDAKYAPVLAYMEQQEAIARESRFDSAYDVLAKPELKPLIGAVAKSMAERGMTFNDEKTMFDALAKEVETVIKVGTPTFTLNAAGAAQPKTKTNGRAPNAIPVTSGGGGGGGGGQGKPPAASTKRGDAIWG